VNKTEHLLDDLIDWSGTVDDRRAEVQIGVGKKCPGQQPPPGASMPCAARPRLSLALAPERASRSTRCLARVRQVDATSARGVFSGRSVPCEGIERPEFVPQPETRLTPKCLEDRAQVA
jgi:hypothetical protein